MFGGFLQRMPHYGACLVVRDLDGVRRLLTAIIRPRQIASEYVFRPLEELETDDRSGRRLRMPRPDRTPGELIDLLRKNTAPLFLLLVMRS